MDIAFAIWLYDPTAEYLLSHSNATKYSDIIEWRGPSELPSEETLQKLWDDYGDMATKEPTLEDRITVLEDEIKKLKEKNPSSS